MKKTALSFMFALAFGFFVNSASAFADPVTLAKAAELALHRVERLVILKKIEDSFQSKPKTLKVVAIAHQTPDDPAYKASILELPGADGTQKSVDIIMNEAGKAISFVVNAGTESASPPLWANIDATTLCENSLHYVLDNESTKAELVPYYVGLSQLSIAPGTNAAGAAVAVIEMVISQTAPILRIRMNLDGTLDSSEIVNRLE